MLLLLLLLLVHCISPAFCNVFSLCSLTPLPTVLPKLSVLLFLLLQYSTVLPEPLCAFLPCCSIPRLWQDAVYQRF